MHPDLEHLIALQAVETETDSARRAIEELPVRRQQIETLLNERRAAVDGARQRAADSQAARRAVEKDLATAQGRLAKFKDQLMEVKTNREYLAMQHEIAVADGEVKRLEDRLLECLLEADEVAAAVKGADAALETGRREAADATANLEREAGRLATRIDAAASERARVAALLSPESLALFEHIRGRRGVAVVEARGGLCTACHVRLRPQVFNSVLRGDAIVQCDSCQRILFHRPAPPQAVAPPAAS